MMPILLLCVLAAQADRVDPPDAASQKEAEKLIKDIFKDDFAKRAAADRVALAKKLLEQAEQSDAERASQFVLFREAKDAAVSGGDYALALRALKLMGEKFKVASVPMMADILAAKAKSIKTPEEASDLGRAYLKLSEEAVLQSDFVTADKAAEQAGALAKRARDVPLVTAAGARTKALSDLKARAAKLAKARETLIKSPDDAAANLIVGYFEITVKRDWDVGLPHLRLSSDAGLKSLAEKDLANPTTPADQTVVGDGWWDVAEKEAGSARDVLRRRAVQWYEKAQPKLTGLNKAKVDRRVTEGKIAELHEGEWLEIADPGAFGAMGKTGETIRIKGSATLTLKSFPSGTFDGVSFFIRSIDGAKPLVEFEADRTGVFIDPKGEVLLSTLNGDRWDPVKWGQGTVNDEKMLLTVIIREGAYVCFVNGRELLRVPTENTSIKALELQNTIGTGEFERIRLRRAD